MVTPAARRAAVDHFRERYGFSERGACRMASFSRSSYRRSSRRQEADKPLRERLLELAAERPRFGYRRLHVLLLREGWEMATGRVFRTLNIVDDATRECLAIEVDTSLSGARTARVLDRVAKRRGSYPSRLVLDNGPECTSKALDQWAYERGVELAFIRPGKPIENCFVESFNGRFRDECLNTHWFVSIYDARRKIEAWRVDYNHVRPHSSLGDLTPRAFARGAGLQPTASTSAPPPPPAQKRCL